MREWVNQARCASDEPGIDPADFQVPLRGDSQNKAKLVCYTCPVQDQCLQWALEHREIWGVWGGLDEAEIRHALSVDSHGRYVKRCRPPGCPNAHCRARPSALEIVTIGRVLGIRCNTCSFEWKSPTSVAAVQHYLKLRRQLEKKRLRLRARVIARGVSLKITEAVVVPIRPGLAVLPPPADLPAALVAAGRPVKPDQASS